MTDPDLRSDAGPTPGGPRETPRATIVRPRWWWGAGLAGVLLAVGAAGGAGVAQVAQSWMPQSVMSLQPSAIAQMKDGGVVAIQGQVAEIFGNKFILQDPTGRALVELGPRGEGGNVVSVGETLTVQGRFERGFLHARVITHADGRSFAFGPPRPAPKKGHPNGPRPNDDEREFGPGPIPMQGPTAQVPTAQGPAVSPPPPPAAAPPPPPPPPAPR